MLWSSATERNGASAGLPPLPAPQGALAKPAAGASKGSLLQRLIASSIWAGESLLDTVSGLKKVRRMGGWAGGQHSHAVEALHCVISCFRWPSG